MRVKKYNEEWWIPMTKASASLVANYRKIRPKTSGPLLFVDKNGLALQLARLAYSFTRANDLLGADLPLTIMLAEFFASNTSKHGKPDATRLPQQALAGHGRPAGGNHVGRWSPCSTVPIH
jgi:hypothetical protein